MLSFVSNERKENKLPPFDQSQIIFYRYVPLL